MVTEALSNGVNGNGKAGTTWNLANLGAVGLVCYLLWYGITATLPQMQDKFHTLISQRDEWFRQELKEQRTQQDRQIDLVTKAISEQSKAIADLATETRKLAVRTGGN